MTRIFCAIALFLLGFTGHSVALPNLEPYSAEYRLPDGTFASMCLPSVEQGGAPHGDSHRCDTCVMAAGHLFTPPTLAFFHTPSLVRGQTIRLAIQVNGKRIVSYHRQSRGPPLAA